MINTDGYIYLYGAQGSGPVSLRQAEKSFQSYLGNNSAKLITINDPSYFKDSQRMKDATAIVIPGGNAYVMTGGLGEKGIQQIKNRVEKWGTSYIGFCAGGYLASNSSYLAVNSRGSHEVLNFDFGLHLVDDLLKGPSYTLYSNVSLLTAKIVPIKTSKESEPFYAYWNGGGTYKCSDKISPLALYEDAHIYNQCAVAKFQCKETVVISNVHPEIRFTSEEFDEYVGGTVNEKARYMESVQKQELLFESICQAAGI